MTREERLRLWESLTPEQRDYDRFVARRIPEGAGWLAETEGGRELLRERDRARMDGECTCHISPPCWVCLETEESSCSKD